MKVKTFLVFAIVLVLLAVLGYLQVVGQRPQGDRGPRIVVEPEKWDFGEVKRPAVVIHDFMVRNAGRETLEIRRVSTSCGCTSAKIAKERIEPGGETILVVTYDSGAMKGEKGPLERTVYIKSNDLENPQIEVTIYANAE